MVNSRSSKTSGELIVVRNRRASFNYELDDRFEAGIVLTGSEVKSIRNGKIEIVDAYASIEGDEIWLNQLYIAPFEQATHFGHEPRRKRKLLLKRREIEKIKEAMTGKSSTIIPLRIYFKEGLAKVEIAIARGKTHGDKRHTIAEKEAEKEARNALGRRQKT